MTDPLNDLLDSSSPRVSSPSSAIDHEMKVLALRTAQAARPAPRRRRTGRRITLGVAGAVLALTGGRPRPQPLGCRDRGRGGSATRT